MLTVLRSPRTLNGRSSVNQDTYDAQDSSEQEPERLETWKRIASFFSCDESTARRWEKSYGMPVHRYGDRGSGVYAYAHELQAWADEHLEVSPEGAPVIANKEVEVLPVLVEEEAESDLASSSGRMRVAAFVVVVIVAVAFLILKAHKPAALSTREATIQTQSTMSAETNSNRSITPPSEATTTPAEVPAKETPERPGAKPTPTATEAAHAFVMASGSNEAEETNKLRKLVQTNPEALQPKRDLAEALLEQRHIPEALPLADDIAKLSGESRDAVTAKALHDGWNSGRTVGAFIALLKADRQEYPHDRSVSPQMALAALQLGHNEEAMKYLRAAVQDNPPQATALLNGIFAAKLGSDKVFEDLRRNPPDALKKQPAEAH
jgi:hypothetical protein